MKDPETLRRFKYAVRVLEGASERELPRALAAVFERHLQSVPPTSIVGPYHRLYAEYWEKLAEGRPMTTGDAVDAASLIAVMYSVMRSTSQQGAEWWRQRREGGYQMEGLR